ncbi:MAG: hypothetical protein QF890_10425, partial [Myxococcota bacterium]|nr:hypothetical protein [Myxococcota bacterium]
GDCMATAWRPHGDRMATAWRPHGDRMATAWRPHGDRMATQRGVFVRRVLSPDDSCKLGAKI